jgi:glycogen operon protein
MVEPVSLRRPDGGTAGFDPGGPAPVVAFDPGGPAPAAGFDLSGPAPAAGFDLSGPAPAHGRRVRVSPGEPYPLGATPDDSGVNFALFSAHADAVDVCLFDTDGRECTRYRLPECTDQVWHGHISGLGPGQRYGYRVHGPYDPVRGHRFNPAKLLIDPYARALGGRYRWTDAHIGSHPVKGDRVPDERDNAADMYKSVVVDTRPVPDLDRPPRTPWPRTVLYEAHVRGMTMRHPDVPPELRGTFRGLASPAIIDHLVKLGVTAVELLPVHTFVEESYLADKGLTNYWGYNTLGFFAPHSAYAHGAPQAEFRAMVRSFHEAGIEVILDVVYNHTAEGNELGPTFCFKGVDNASYYRLIPGKLNHYENHSGCGNTLNLRHSRVLQMVMDSLRSWVETMHVDGFRFDLAPALAREQVDFDDSSGFIDAVRQDPVLSRVKMIAEPWDLGPGGYRLGGFPPGWSEWNGRYRDTVRRFWSGASGLAGDVASCVSGSSDLFAWGHRRPWASVNFITAHDGFTLTDLVSYDRKHNEANLEHNRDGTDANWSWNCGAEGPSDDQAVNRLRLRQRRNMVATLLLSQGVPMILGGDELGHSQGGNNNAYCQDNGTSWLEWGETDAGWLDFVRAIIGLRLRHPAFRRAHFFTGRPAPTDPDDPAADKDIRWLTPSGAEMAEADWSSGVSRSLAFALAGMPGDGEGLREAPFVVLMNAGDAPLAHRLPAAAGIGRWTVVVETASETGLGDGRRYDVGGVYELAPHALTVMAGL